MGSHRFLTLTCIYRLINLAFFPTIQRRRAPYKCVIPKSAHKFPSQLSVSNIRLKCCILFAAQSIRLHICTTPIKPSIHIALESNPKCNPTRRNYMRCDAPKVHLFASNSARNACIAYRDAYSCPKFGRNYTKCGDDYPT